MRRTALALVVSLLATLAVAVPAAAASTWSVAVVVYDSIDATCQGRQITASLQDGEQDVAEALADLNTAKARIEAAGDGTLSFTVFRAGTLTGDLTPHGSACWPAPSDVSDLGDYPSGFDSVYVLYESDDDPNPGVNGWGGLSYACGGCPLYATNPIWDGSSDWFDGGYNVGIFLHEWGNNLTAFYQPLFGSTQVPSLYSDQSRYTFDGDWKLAWYGGRLFDTVTREYVGLESHVWAVSPVGDTAEPAKPCRNGSSNAKACRP